MSDVLEIRIGEQCRLEPSTQSEQEALSFFFLARGLESFPLSRVAQEEKKKLLKSGAPLLKFCILSRELGARHAVDQRNDGSNTPHLG